MSGSKNKDSVDTFITLEAFSEFRFEVEHKNEIVELQVIVYICLIFALQKKNYELCRLYLDITF